MPQQKTLEITATISTKEFSEISFANLFEIFIKHTVAYVIAKHQGNDHPHLHVYMRLKKPTRIDNFSRNFHQVVPLDQLVHGVQLTPSHSLQNFTNYVMHEDDALLVSNIQEELAECKKNVVVFQKHKQQQNKKLTKYNAVDEMLKFIKKHKMTYIGNHQCRLLLLNLMVRDGYRITAIKNDLPIIDKQIRCILGDDNALSDTAIDIGAERNQW